jgi:hypothetical protein
MNEDLAKKTPENEDPFAWMRPFMSPPMRLSRNAQEQPYAPPARDLLLRSAQEEEMLECEIWKLALSEAYSANNLGWLNRMAGCEKQMIIADYYRRHPAMERFVKAHTDKGTCGRAIEVLKEEQERRRAGPEPSKATQEQVDSWMLEYHKTAEQEGRQPPKQADDSFLACRQAIGATDSQMRIAIKKVPPGIKRTRGGRDR